MVFQNFRFSTLNTHGLRFQQKIAEIFAQVADDHVIEFTETNFLDENNAEQFTHFFELDFLIEHSFAESRHRGVTLAISRKTAPTHIERLAEIPGRALCVSCYMLALPVLILSVYGPANRQERVNFYETVVGKSEI